MKKIAIAAVLLVLFSYTGAQAQFLKGIIINRYDRNALHHGKWKYIDRSHGRRLVCFGRFDHGRQIGDWQYFHPNGKLRMTEKYTWEGDKRLVNVSFYHENGLVATQGLAMVEVDGGKTHYYWNGDWIYFDPDGSFSKTVTYNYGQPVKSTFADGHVEMEQVLYPARQVEMPMR
jgi:antitoxin component YwqK of YwqJK toxin-antitoxin module